MKDLWTQVENAKTINKKANHISTLTLSIRLMILSAKERANEKSI